MTVKPKTPNVKLYRKALPDLFELAKKGWKRNVAAGVYTAPYIPRSKSKTKI